MNSPNENQHWISRILLKQFRRDALPLQCFQVATGEWIEKSIDRICSSPGYNQLLVSGETDNDLEAAFSKIESGLRKSLRALEGASDSSKTELPQAVYENICWYCSFLKGIAPYSKPAAVASFLFQLNWEIEHGKISLLRELDVPDETIQQLRWHHSMGNKVIVQSENLLQLIFRFQFARTYHLNFFQFLNTKWAVSKTSIEMPMSDVGLVPLVLQSLAATHYLLPLGPHLLLQGLFFHDVSKNSAAPVVHGFELPETEERQHHDCICASAISEIICSQKLEDISAARIRARKDGIRFCKLIEPGQIKSSGLVDVGHGNLVFHVVSSEEYRRVVHAYMQPWD